MHRHAEACIDLKALWGGRRPGLKVMCRFDEAATLWPPPEAPEDPRFAEWA